MSVVLIFERVVNDGEFPASKEVVDSDWSDVDAAIRAMDGRLLTSVVLSRDDWSSLSIGGGGTNFNVVLTTAEEEFLSLLSRTPPDAAEIGLVVGGQLGYYPGRRIVNLEEALSAARFYWEQEGVPAGLTWDTD